MSRWTDRHVAMLREMGVQHFWPTEEEPAEATTIPVSSAVGPDPVQSLPSTGAVPVAARPQAPVAAPAASPARTRPATPASALTPTPAQAGASAAVNLGVRPVGVDTMDWPALREAVAGCEACGLCKSRRQTVFGVGNPKAHWMLVGEAPGEQEDREGEPFVGRAGQLLDRMLMATGLTRSEAPPEQQVYIANVIKCRPPGNRNPLPEEVAQCEPFLLRQLQLVQPRVILAMGRFAAHSLLKSTEPIGRLRGRIHDYGGVPLVVTYHPAYLLRNPVDKALVWDDLCLARELLAKPSA